MFRISLLLLVFLSLELQSSTSSSDRGHLLIRAVSRNTLSTTSLLDWNVVKSNADELKNTITQFRHSCVDLIKQIPNKFQKIQIKSKTSSTTNEDNIFLNNVEKDNKEVSIVYFHDMNVIFTKFFLCH